MLQKPHPLVSSLGGEEGAGNQTHTFLEVKKIAEHLGAGMDADSPGQLWAACPPGHCLYSLFALHMLQSCLVL